VSRDPPHFEFRGTPEQAAAIADFNLRNDPNRRCWDTVDDDGVAQERCNLTGAPAAGWRLPVEVDAPAGTVAAMINLAVVAPDRAGYLTVESCGAVAARRTTSSINFGAGETASAMAIAPLTDGRFCVYRSAAAHSVVDVVGYIGADGEPPDDAPRLVNLTVVDAVAPGHAAAGRCDAVTANKFANINYAAHAIRANVALVDNGEAGSCVWTLRDTDVVVDELGRLRPDDGYGWAITTARRLLDTRRCTDVWCGDLPSGGRAFAVDLDIDSPAAVVSLTIAGATAPGHAWIGACDELVDGVATTSNVNYVPGTAVSNLAVIEPRDGRVCVYLHSAAHVVVDLQAELVADHTIGVVPVTPHRVHDSRH
jgi:hypothetical protein